jgi:Flp pilus assembly pilin Flp
MITARLAAMLTMLVATLYQRVDRLRREPDHGGHAVEYAIGIGGSAVVILGVIAALKSGLKDVIKAWIFK